ncbi:Dynamin family protein [Desulfacinum hydrothermale DSM 13146]|uniref:Dynamin family protein n=1 Tax=Desulfacinum hydrothermale DSM 13146 TaxID=1121390 RepID=A0A1W1XK38_9BACT|nr:dynamin family protein [Desulfacinum hydrothermale]SMC24134.1 Dynamin family protein [Desulfacinum hydrothermale DSM 13146]
MNEFLRFRDSIALRTASLRSSVERLLEDQLIDSQRAALWLEHLNLVSGALQDPLVRVAVVGSVKSGKSTLINALLGRDLLRRGAGIITSFITRIRSNTSQGGWVELKSWPEIHREVREAVALLPPTEDGALAQEEWDLRNPDHRGILQERLRAVQREWQQSRGSLEANFVLLQAYLNGFDDLEQMVGEEPNRLHFDANTLEEHQKFVGRESHAVYLKDVQLHYPVPWLGEEVEIADCQGSDAPNPLHFALLQAYLLKAHLIVYVVSSRTGLREADLKLLQFIKTLRMLPHTLFVLNLDLDNHQGPDDVHQSIERLRQELEWTVPQPHVFSFSALYHLIQAQGERAPAKDRRRFQIWNDEFADGHMDSVVGFQQLQERLSERIGRQRIRVLFGSGLNRLGVVAHALSETTRTQRQLLGQNVDQLKRSAKRLQDRQEALLETLGTLENAISGLRDTLRQDLDRAVGTFFDLSYGAVVQETLQMVDTHPVDPSYLKDLSDPAKVLKQLHRYYLDFRRSLSVFLVEKVNLATIEFAKEQEQHLRSRLSQSSRAFWALFETAMEEYHRELASFGVETRGFQRPPETGWNEWEEITPPAFSGFVDENALGRGALLMKFGIGRVSRLLNTLKTRLGRKGRAEQRSAESDTLREAIEVVKAEARSELLYAFRDYRQNFRFQYLHRLLDVASAKLVEEFRLRARMAQVDFSDLLRQGRQEESVRQRHMTTLEETARFAEEQLDAIEELRRALNLEWFPEEQAANPGEQALSDGGAAG